MAFLLGSPSGLGGILSAPCVSQRERDIGAVEGLSVHVFDVSAALAAPTANRMMKKRGLTDLLRRLEGAGVSPLSSSVPSLAKNQCALAQLPPCSATPGYATLGLLQVGQAGDPPFLPTRAPNKCPGSAALGAGLSASREYFFKCSDQLMRLRVVVASGAVHKDVTPGETRRAQGLCEHMWGLALAQRQLLGGALAAIEKQAMVVEALGRLERQAAPPLPLAPSCRLCLWQRSRPCLPHFALGAPSPPPLLQAARLRCGRCRPAAGTGRSRGLHKDPAENSRAHNGWGGSPGLPPGKGKRC